MLYDPEDSSRRPLPPAVPGPLAIPGHPEFRRPQLPLKAKYQNPEPKELPDRKTSKNPYINITPGSRNPPRFIPCLGEAEDHRFPDMECFLFLDYYVVMLSL